MQKWLGGYKENDLDEENHVTFRNVWISNICHEIDSILLSKNVLAPLTSTGFVFGRSAGVRLALQRSQSEHQDGSEQKDAQTAGGDD